MRSKCFRKLPQLSGGFRRTCLVLAMTAAFGILALRRPAHGLAPAGPVAAGESAGGGLAARAGAAAESGGKKSPEKADPKTAKKNAGEDPAKPDAKGKDDSSGGNSGSSPKTVQKPEEKPSSGSPGGSKTGDPGKSKAEVKKVLSIDEEYVKENLEKYLSPTKIEWKDDGTVRLVFNFRGKREEHESIFTPRVSKEVGSNFRWSLRGEYGYSGGYVSDPDDERRDGDDDYYYNALRIAMKGAAHLNVWFLDDVDIEIDYVQSISFNNKQTAALVLTNGSGTSLASNFGTQCIMLSSGRPQKVSGNVEAVSSESRTKLRLVVKDGNFEAYRDGRKKSTMTYSPKSFASNRIGFLWGGGIAGFIRRMEIKGRVDAKKMAQILRKAQK